MHFHLPSPIHGWRQFSGEVGIIVLGILIALGAEQVIEGIHDRHVAEQSRRDVREEVGTDLGFYRGRLADSACIASRLSELSKIVESGTVAKGTVLWVGRPGDFVPFTERWDAVTASARSTLFSSAEQGSLDAIYGIFVPMKAESQMEQEAWTTLNILGHFDGPIDPATRLALRIAIEQARRTDAVFNLAGYYALFHAGKMKIASNPATSPRAEDVHSVCLPIATAPEQAERLLQPRKAT